MKPSPRPSTGVDPISARRRLIRGVFSTAAVVPLTSGAQVAASSAIRCFNNTPVNQGPVADNMYAVQVYTVRFTKNGGGNADFIEEQLVLVADVTKLGSTHKFSVSALVGNATSLWLRTDGKPFSIPNNYSFAKQTGTQTRLPLRFVNNGSGSNVSMQAVGIGLAPTTTQGDRVLYASCWASFNPA